ncbi:MAG: N-acetylmuramoyl-L-alanine amidase [Eubacteriales bacterium]|nr:N-acetylmuramoyl-L-alanine amidase [Eubacteriales bacterium]
MGKNLKNREGSYLRRIVLMMACCLFLLSFSVSADNVVIVVDPGHGGREAGAGRTWSFGTYKEELINLSISLYLKEELETYSGVEVYLTRKNNFKTMDRETRLKIAKSYGADALVSIHINSTGAQKGNLTGCYSCVPSPQRYSDIYGQKSRELADAILASISRRTGMKNNGYWLDDELGIILFGMKYRIPSMIIEHCFVNNPSDCKKYLSTPQQLKLLGVADAEGIAAYYGLKKRTAAEISGDLTGYTGWRKTGSKYYYYIDGVKQTGLINVDGNSYILNSKGVRKTGLIKMDGALYYADKRGRLQTGWQKYKKKTYYFDEETKAARTGIVKIGKKKYCFSKETCERISGWVRKGKKRYFFSAVDGKMLKNYWLKDKTTGAWYYLSASGAAYRNKTVTIKGTSYTFDKNGVCLNR